jgi:hypothetical protein
VENKGKAREKEETPEEKKLRKKQVKMERKVRRFLDSFDSISFFFRSIEKERKF